MLLATMLGGLAAAAARPHILWIVMDDLGWDDVGFRSHEILTPNIDRFAKEGVALEQYYSQDVCSPARATFLTGRYAFHHSIVDWIPPQQSYGLPLNETTIADLLQRSGYDTRAVGKWHVGFYLEGMTPTFRGFNSFYGFYGGGEDYFSHVKKDAYDFHRDPSPRCNASCRQVADDAVGGYSTTLFSAEAVRVIEAHDTSKPLFMYLAYQAVHAPSEVPMEYEAPYNKTIADPLRRRFAGMLSCADEGIGNVTRAMEARGMLKNTFLIFTSDNGGPLGKDDGIGARNWPLRGGKHSIWEGGTRVVGYAWGPGVGVPGGMTYGGLMHGADWLPTLCELAGASTAGTLPLDGVSQLRNLRNPELPSPRDGFVYGNSTDNCQWNPKTNATQCGFGVRYGSWKYIRGYGGPPDKWCNISADGDHCGVPYGKEPVSGCAGGHCLYDVVADPSEVSEVAAQHPDVVAQLSARIDAALATGYHQGRADPACMPARHIDDSKVPTGKVWAPWCE